jgi:hypothetical protein
LNQKDEHLTESELAPRMAITDDLVRLISEGKARIVDKREGKPVNGRRMVEIDVEMLD